MNNRICQFCGYVIPNSIEFRKCCIKGHHEDIYNDDISDRKGKFYVTKKVYEDLLKNKVWRELFFSKFVISRCEFLYIENCFEFYAYSEKFDKLPESKKVPKYNIIFHKHVFNPAIKVEKNEQKI